MSQQQSIESLIGKLKNLYSGSYLNILKKESKEALCVALYKSVQEMSKQLKPNFDRIVDSEFYDAYSPMFYKSDRRYSMRKVFPPKDPELLQAETDEGCNISISIQVNKEAMKFRKGGTNLIYLTLGYGYHGGAYGTDRNGSSVSSPHYRRPLNTWSRWGSPAVQTESPWQLYKAWFEDYWSDETLQALLESNFYPRFGSAIAKYMKNI